MIGTFTLLVALLAGEAIARSRMGLVLTIFALLGAFALAVSDRRVGSAVTATRLIVGAGALALIFSAQFALYGIMERLVQDPLRDARIPFGRNTIEAAIAYMPLGSGLGTFVPVYAMFEKPEDAIRVDTYANHAHNDVLELWLTTGAVGLVLMGMFVVWLLLRSFEIWRSAPARGASELDWTLARAATIVVALLVAHSFVDYPLRTGAMMAVMAFACALLIEPPLGAETRAQQTSALKPKRTRHPQMKRLAPAAPLAVPKPTPMPVAGSSEVGSLSPDRRWGTDVNWPDEWSKSSKASSASGPDKPPKVPKPPKGS
jgi:O-antigen ligase